MLRSCSSEGGRAYFSTQLYLFRARFADDVNEVRTKTELFFPGARDWLYAHRITYRSYFADNAAVYRQTMRSRVIRVDFLNLISAGEKQEKEEYIYIYME